MKLGMKVRAARKAREMSLADTVEALRENLVDLPISTLSRMEDGSRPGDPRAWGGLWTLFRLPLHDLYTGLGLPVERDDLSPATRSIVSEVEPMPEATQQAALALIRHLPAVLNSAGLTSAPYKKGRPVKRELPRAAEPKQRYKRGGGR